MERHELTPLIEALLFAADQPLTLNALVKAVDDDSVTRADVRAVLDALRETCDAQGRGCQIVRLGTGYQMLTRARHAPWVENLQRTRRRVRLSRPALETAAVIAYKQPISRIEIERIRGVDAGAVLATLLEREIIMIKGRDPGPGRPLLYGTTQKFLEYFGLSNLNDLPRLDELATLAGMEREEWSEDERGRFERHGIDLAQVPTPGDLLHAGPEEPPAGDEPDPGEPAPPPAEEALPRDAASGDDGNDGRSIDISGEL